MSDLPPASRPTLEDRPRKRWVQPVLVIAILALVALGAWLAWGWTHPSSPAAVAAKAKAAAGAKGGRFAVDPSRIQPVTAVAAKLGDVNVVQTALGTVSAFRTVTVRPRVDGLLQNVAFADGQMVKPGDVLAQIDPVPFQVALEQVEGQLARDAAQLNNARLDLDRYRTLLKQDSIAEQQVDQQASQVKQLEGTVKLDQALVDNAKLQLSYTHITAPIGGRLGLRIVDAGNMVHGSDTAGIAVITQVQPITVLYTIPQDTLPRVLERMRSGDKLARRGMGPRSEELLSRGTLISTDNQIDVTTGTVRLKARVPESRGQALPQPVRERAHGGGHAQRRGRRALGRDPAQRARHLRVGGERRRHRGAAARDHRPHRRHGHRDRNRRAGGRARGHRRRGPHPRGREGGGRAARRRTRRGVPRGAREGRRPRQARLAQG